MFTDFLQQFPPLTKQTIEETSPSASVGWPPFSQPEKIAPHLLPGTHWVGIFVPASPTKRYHFPNIKDEDSSSHFSCHTASIQNPLKVTIFNEFQCMTVARSLSDRFSHSPTIIDCWPQKWLLMNVKPSNLLISTPVNCISEHGQLRWEPITAEAIKNLFSVFTYSHLNTRWGWENLRKLRELDTQSRVCITLKTFPSLEYLTEKT